VNQTKPWKIVYAGTPEIAVPALRYLAGKGRVAAVLSSPDQEAGRGRKLTQSPVKEAAVDLGLTVLSPEKLNQEVREQIATFEADLLVCFAYGKIFGPKFLGLFPGGGINLHPSLLPRYRGPSPIPAAILAGDPETGISVQELALGMDEGNIHIQEKIPLYGNETAGSLSEYCAQRAGPLLEQALLKLESGNLEALVQDPSKASYCSLLFKEQGRIDWSKSASEIDRLIRAFTPSPRAWTLWEGKPLYIDAAGVLDPSDPEYSNYDSTAIIPGTVLKVDKAKGYLVQTGKGILSLRQLQMQAKKSLDYRAFNNGVRNFVGAVLGV